MGKPYFQSFLDLIALRSFRHSKASLGFGVSRESGISG